MPSPWILPSARWPARTVRARWVPNTRRAGVRSTSGSKARASSMVRDLYSRGANRLDHALDDMGSVDAVGMRGVVKHDAMREAGDRDALDVLARDVGTAVEQRADLGAENKRLCAARTRAEHHIAIHHLVVHTLGLVADEARILRLSRSHQARGINLELRRNHHVTHQALQSFDSLGSLADIEDWFDSRIFRAGGG